MKIFQNKNNVLFPKFIFWGLINTAISYPVFPILYKYIFFNNFLLSSVISIFFAISSSFLLQKKLTFKTQGNYLLEYYNFWRNSIIAIIISTFLLYFFVELLLIDPFISQAIVIIIGAISMFFVHKKYTFKIK